MRIARFPIGLALLLAALPVIVGANVAKSEASSVDLPEPQQFAYDSASPRQVLDLYKPTGAGPFPVVVWFHGGAWASGDKRDDQAVFEEFADRYAVVSVDYRYATSSSYPATTDDALDALQKVQRDGAAYGLDTSRIAVMGFSAGGHLAALSALRSPSGVDLVATLATPGDLSKLFSATDSGEIRELVDCWVPTTSACLPAVRAADPDNQVNAGSPPFFVQHGSADTLVPQSIAKSFVSSLKAKKVPVRTEYIAGMGHTYRITPALVAAVDKALAGN